MAKNVLKNSGALAVFIFSIIFFGVLFGGFGVPPQAHAYAVGPVATDTSTGSGGGSYDIGTSFQNLISPFTGFLSALKWNTNTTINTNGTPGNTNTWPTVNITPVLESSLQNILSSWLSEFDNWFYGLTGVQLSGILFVLLNATLWTLHLAESVVNWLLGLFH